MAEVSEIINGNRYRGFPSASRGRDRLFPVARPQFGFDIQFPDNPSFFIAGNCFARSMEKALAFGGFTILSSVVSDDIPGTVFQQLERYNKFNLDVVANEVAWATGQRTDMDDCLIQVGDEHVDMQLHFSYAYSHEDALKYRRIFNKSFAKISDADVIVLTIGGPRQWYDCEHKIYLNAMPTHRMNKQYPNRFALHEFNLADAEKRIEECIDIVRNVNPTANILLVNSPVFQPNSTTRSDTLIDQTLGKCLQRLAIDNVIRNSSNIYYLPAYEAVTLSDFKHSFNIKDPSHTLPDVGIRVSADMLSAGGIKDQRQKLIEAIGFGRVFFAAGEFEKAEKLMQPVIFGGDGGITETARRSDALCFLYVRNLSALKQWFEALEFGMSVIGMVEDAEPANNDLGADGSGPQNSESSDDEIISAATAILATRPTTAFVDTVHNLALRAGNEEYINRLRQYAEKHGLRLTNPASAGAGSASGNPDALNLSKAYNAGEYDKVLSIGETVDAKREALNENDRSRCDRLIFMAGISLNKKKQAFDRMIRLARRDQLSAHAAHVMGNNALTKATSEQIAEILDLKIVDTMPPALVARLRAMVKVKVTPKIPQEESSEE